MAQFSKDVFNIAPGLGRAISDPREAEARAREASRRADASLRLDAVRAAQANAQQTLARQQQADQFAANLGFQNSRLQQQGAQFQQGLQHQAQQAAEQRAFQETLQRLGIDAQAAQGEANRAFQNQLSLRQEGLSRDRLAQEGAFAQQGIDLRAQEQAFRQALAQAQLQGSLPQTPTAGVQQASAPGAPPQPGFAPDQATLLDVMARMRQASQAGDAEGGRQASADARDLIATSPASRQFLEQAVLQAQQTATGREDSFFDKVSPGFALGAILKAIGVPQAQRPDTITEQKQALANAFSLDAPSARFIGGTRGAAPVPGFEPAPVVDLDQFRNPDSTGRAPGEGQKELGMFDETKNLLDELLRQLLK